MFSYYDMYEGKICINFFCFYMEKIICYFYVNKDVLYVKVMKFIVKFVLFYMYLYKYFFLKFLIFEFLKNCCMLY